LFLLPCDQVISSGGLAGAELQTFADAWHFREKLQRTFDGFFSTDDVSLAFARYAWDDGFPLVCSCMHVHRCAQVLYATSPQLLLLQGVRDAGRA
jgi:hypothetical protein